MKKIKSLLSSFTDEKETTEKTANDFCKFIQERFTPVEQSEIIAMVKEKTLIHFDFIDNELMQKVENVGKGTSNLNNL